jgi:uncharacterized protein YbjQ (UPF0145 family)
MWECKKCRERVENTFDVCWSCGTSREGVEDPLFQRETEAEIDVEKPAPQAKAPRRTLPKLIVTTGNDVSGRTIASYLGIVRGVVVRSPGFMQGFLGGLQKLAGGNLEAYAQVCDEARRDAFERMVEHAEEIGADAVIGMRYDATDFAEGITEVLAYGTAVKLG